MRNYKLPDFLYQDNSNRIRVGYHGDTDVTDEWNTWIQDLETTLKKDGH